MNESQSPVGRSASNNSDGSVETVGQATARKSPRRTTSKDHLQSPVSKFTVVGNQAADFIGTDPLVFWTFHPSKPHLVDLREFADGTLDQSDAKTSFRGRRSLIEQVAPAFQARHSMAAPRTIHTVKCGLRKWWRLFDDIEAEEQSTLPHGALAKRLTSVLDLGALHGSRAVQSGMSKNDFHSFVVLADITRLALGKRPLYWASPEKRKRQLAVVPPPEDIKTVYHGIKADWRAAQARWALGDGLAAGPEGGGFEVGESPDANIFRKNVQRAVAEGREDQAMQARQRLSMQHERERVLADGLRLWHAAAARLGRQDLRLQDILDNAGERPVLIGANNFTEVAEALYPNGVDIRSAFFLCMAVGGLNPSVLVDLRLDLSAGLDMPDSLKGPKADEVARHEWVMKRCPFIVQSPIDGEYYIEGWKERAKSWISRTYKWKQQLTPGPILTELIIRTWPLRLALSRELEATIGALDSASKSGADADEQNRLRKRVLELTDAVRSVWLHRAARKINWLDGTDYHRADPGGHTYLQAVTRRVNVSRRTQGRPEIEAMEPRRFRDAYAAWALDYTGGEILAVMVALDHRHISTTDSYLENTVVRGRVAKKHRTFMQSLFGSLASGRLDPTLVAMETRFAGTDGGERSRMAGRLVEYRNAVKSRYGVGCRDPHHPAPVVDPSFEADGVRACSAHRCTLCHANAIITPEAYPGLMLRQAELEIREESMPMASFILSSFDAELQNVRAALLPLKESEPERLGSTVELHKREIREGKRRVPGFSVKYV